MYKLSNRLERLLILVPYIVSGKISNIKDLSNMLGLPEKELLADLDKLQLCGVPNYLPDRLIEYFIDEKGNVTLRRAEYLPHPVKLNYNEAIAILHALSLVKKVSNRVVAFDTINSIESKIKESLPEQLVKKIYDAKGFLKFEAFRGENADTIIEGCKNSTSVHIEYVSMDGAKTNRLIDPLAVICFCGKWYVIAFCQLRNDFRMFLFKRITDARKTGKKFEKPANFKPDEYLQTFFYPTEKDLKVRLEFDRSLARVVSENWQDEQVEKLGNGNLILTFYTKSFPWLIGRLLTWGKNVKVLEPKELKTKLLKTLP